MVMMISATRSKHPFSPLPQCTVSHSSAGLITHSPLVRIYEAMLTRLCSAVLSYSTTRSLWLPIFPACLTHLPRTDRYLSSIRQRPRVRQKTPPSQGGPSSLTPHLS